jgi:hypothetical protein
VNFMAYHYGPGVEYNRWADHVGDEAWRLESVKEKLLEVRESCNPKPVLDESSTDRM